MTFSIRYKYYFFCVLLLACGLFLPTVADSQANQANSVRVGMVKSIFRDVPDNLQRFLMVPFGNLMQKQTGMHGQMVLVDDPFDLGEQLEKKQVQLAVFHGFEFAWVQEKNPKLKPLMIAVNRQRQLTAGLVTRSDATIKNFADMRGKTISLPLRSCGQCWLFMDRHCEKAGCQPESFFGKIQRHSNIEDALDDVIRGRVAGIIVDSVSLECYREVKPNLFQRLKVVKRSPTFPAGVIAYREGYLDATTLTRFRTGMLKANTDPQSRQLMMLCKLTAFEAVPSNYQQMLSGIREDFPAPDLTETRVEEPTATRE